MIKQRDNLSKVKIFLLTIIIGDYILDKMVNVNKVSMYPKPFNYLKNKYIEYKLK